MLTLKGNKQPVEETEGDAENNLQQLYNVMADWETQQEEDDNSEDAQPELNNSTEMTHSNEQDNLTGQEEEVRQRN